MNNIPITNPEFIVLPLIFIKLESSGPFVKCDPEEILYKFYFLN
jgi:hypothetical protein